MPRSSIRLRSEAVDQLTGSPTSQRRCSPAGLVSGSIVVVVADVVMFSKKSTETGAAGDE